MFLPYFGFFSELWLYRPTVTWNLCVLHVNKKKPMPLSSNRPQEPLKMCVGFSLLYNFDSCFCPLLATLVISIESALDFWNLCNYQETHMMDLLHSSPLALYAWSPDATTFCKKWAMAPVAMTLWTNGRPSKYLKSMANGLRGAGYIHSFTISAIMSQSLLSD